MFKLGAFGPVSLATFLLLSITTAATNPRRPADEQRGARVPATNADSSRSLRNFTDHSKHESNSPSMIEPVFGYASNQQQWPTQRPNAITLANYQPEGQNEVERMNLAAEGRQAAQDDSGPPQVLLADENTIVPQEVLVQPFAAHTAPQMAMMSGAYQAGLQQAPTQQTQQSQQQVLASLYIDQFGNQQLRLLPFEGAEPAQFVPAGQLVQQQQQQQQQYRSASEPASNFYDTQPAAGQQTHAPQRSHGETDGRHAKKQPAPAGKPRLAHGLKFEEEQGAKEPLSNAQLSALIDELKEFNSKQASRMKATETRLPKPQTDADREEEEKAFDSDYESDPSTPDTRKTAPVDREDRGRRKRQPAPRAATKSDMSTDDLAKFAKFLMTKEGSNMRFQLGLEKDTPDDGDIDEDEKDSLLESKREQRKAETQQPDGKANSPRDLNDLDQRNSEVSEQMDKLLESLTGALDEAAKKNKSKKRAEIDEGDERLRRARRDSVDQGGGKPGGGKLKLEIISETLKRVRDEQPMVMPLREKGHGDNFAKQLIAQELRQDKLESKLRSVQQDSSAPDQSIDQRSLVSSASNRPGKTSSFSDSLQVSGGSESGDYPSVDRNRDRVALVNQLVKSRNAKSKMQSGSFVAEEPLISQALDGQLGIRAESYPDGRLVLRSGRGQPMTLKLPKKEESSYVAKHATFNGNTGPAGDKMGAASYSEQDKLARIKVGSERPVKDEYPISEKVSQGLNELSNNLDRYFNDGFINEAEAKSNLLGEKKRRADDTGDKKGSSTATAEQTTSAGSEAKEAPKGDQDFDVNVGIDGKRESANKDDDYDYEQDDDAEAAKVVEKPNLPEKAKVRIKKPSARPKIGARKSRAKWRAEREPEPNIMRNGFNGHKGAKRANKLDEELDSKSFKQNLSAGDEHLSYENTAGPLPGKLDPVEGESFDSPIGPDGDDLELKVPPSADKKVESSHESKDVVTRHGKRVLAPKFYEEPDWR